MKIQYNMYYQFEVIWIIHAYMTLFARISCCEQISLCVFPYIIWTTCNWIHVHMSTFNSWKSKTYTYTSCYSLFIYIIHIFCPWAENNLLYQWISGDEPFKEEKKKPFEVNSLQLKWNVINTRTFRKGVNFNSAPKNLLCYLN